MIGTMHPVGSFGGQVARRAWVAHCLLLERRGGLLLVDTGFGTAHVTDIALTHLDVDHVGGLSDVPAARVHVFADAHDTGSVTALDDVLLISLQGRTRGHCGGAVRRADAAGRCTPR